MTYIKFCASICRGFLKKGLFHLYFQSLPIYFFCALTSCLLTYVPTSSSLLLVSGRAITKGMVSLRLLWIIITFHVMSGGQLHTSLGICMHALHQSRVVDVDSHVVSMCTTSMTPECLTHEMFLWNLAQSPTSPWSPLTTGIKRWKE